MAAKAVIFISLIFAQIAKSENRSLTNSELRHSPTKMTIDVPVVTNDEEAFSSLQEKQVLLEATVRSLTNSLVQANLNAEASRRQVADMALKLETFGISNINKDPASSEQKLLSAVAALSELKQQGDEVRLGLVRLIEAIATLMKTADRVDPVARLAVETELRKARAILEASPLGAKAQALTVSLTNALVIEVKDDLSLVIANVGKKQGVQIGMLFKVLRKQKEIATIRVVDVRDRICGAIIIQNLSSVPVRQGDNLQIETIKP